MNKNLVENIDTFAQDNLIAKLIPATDTFGVTIKKLASGTADTELKRGTILGEDADGKMAVYSGSTGENALKISCILADGVTLTDEADETSVAYRSGNFNAAAVIVGEGYTLTNADKDDLRKYGIILTDML